MIKEQPFAVERADWNDNDSTPLQRCFFVTVLPGQ